MRDALTRIAGFTDPPLEPIVPAASQFHYRNKLEYSFTEPGRPALGFHRAGRWDEVLEIEECLLTTSSATRSATRCEAWAREEELEAYDQVTQTGYLRHLVVREGRNTGQALVAARHRPGRALRRRLPDRDAASLPRGALDPLGRQRHAGRGDQPADAAALGRGLDRGADPRAALPGAAERIPPDEHGDGRAAATHSPAKPPR